MSNAASRRSSNPEVIEMNKPVRAAWSHLDRKHPDCEWALVDFNSSASIAVFRDGKGSQARLFIEPQGIGWIVRELSNEAGPWVA